MLLRQDGLWIGDCDPAFLCGRDASDRLPFMQTGYVAEQYLAPLGFEQCTGVFASVLKPLKRWVHVLLPHPPAVLPPAVGAVLCCAVLHLRGPQRVFGRLGP